MAKRYKGRTKWFSADRGYGFCTVDDDPDKKEYFIHYSVIEMDGYKTLRAKQPITFELKETDKGVQAVNVKPE